MRTSRQTSSALGVVLSVLSAVGLIVFFYFLPTRGHAQAELTIRGRHVDPDTFSLASLQPRSMKQKVQIAQQVAFQQCMASHGFATQPAPDADPKAWLAYNEVGSGDDGTDALPPTREVSIAPGVRYPLAVTWTPESCQYKSYLAVGVDPLRFEATRERMQELLVQANQDAAPDLADDSKQWGACVGNNDADPQGLLNALDGFDRGPYPDASSCITPEIRADATKARAAAHLAVARENQGVVDAWVELVDDEAAAVEKSQ